MKNRPRYDFTSEERLHRFAPLVLASWVPMVIAVGGATVGFGTLFCYAMGYAPNPALYVLGFLVGVTVSMNFVLRTLRRLATCPHRRHRPLTGPEARIDKFDACPQCSGPTPHKPQPIQAINVPYGQRVPRLGIRKHRTGDGTA